MFRDQITAFLATINSANSRSRYAAALDEFATWYVGSYGQPPDARLLTDEEGREWAAYLRTVRRLSASSVNLRLAALRGVARHHGRRLQVKGVKKVQTELDPLNGREIGRLVAVLDGQGWLEKRNVALVSLMARAGLRVGEVVVLQIDDVTHSERKGQVQVRQGEGKKERTVPLSKQARAEIESAQNT